ncbi:MAG: hypothetical protein ACREMB_13365 [Candidatus Rokuibacteriota bacterium]
MEPDNGVAFGARFFLVEDDGASASGPRLSTARAALREAQQTEWEERQRLARAGAAGVTPTHAALLQSRQTQTQAALAAVEDLRRRAVSLRQAIALGEEALARQRLLVERMRRELTEIGE